MKDATPTQVINEEVTRTEAPTAAEESPRAAVPTLCENQIRELAYRNWQGAGCPENDGVDCWLQAEQELTSQACQCDAQ